MKNIKKYKKIRSGEGERGATSAGKGEYDKIEKYKNIKKYKDIKLKRSGGR